MPLFSQPFVPFLPLTNDLVFKSCFVRHIPSLISLLNSILHFEAGHEIAEVTVKNSEIPITFEGDKLIRLDIYAVDKQNRR